VENERSDKNKVVFLAKVPQYGWRKIRLHANIDG